MEPRDQRGIEVDSLQVQYCSGTRKKDAAQLDAEGRVTLLAGEKPAHIFCLFCEIVLSAVGPTEVWQFSYR